MKDVNGKVTNSDVMKEVQKIGFQHNSIDVKIDLLQYALDQIPEFLSDMNNVKCPYLFKIVTEAEYKDFCEKLETAEVTSVDHTVAKRLEDRIYKAQNLLESCVSTVEELKKKRRWRNLLGKKQRVYLQILCGFSFQPVVAYEVKHTIYSAKVKRIMKFGAAMCSIGIRTSILWITTAEAACFFGYPLPTINKEQLDKCKAFLKKVNEGDTSETFEGKESSLMQAKLGTFHSFIEYLEKKGAMRHMKNETDKPILKGTKWQNGMQIAFAELEGGRKQLTWIDNQNSDKMMVYT